MMGSMSERQEEMIAAFMKAGADIEAESKGELASLAKQVRGSSKLERLLEKEPKNWTEAEAKLATDILFAFNGAANLNAL
jgi:hypothetical protein